MKTRISLLGSLLLLATFTARFAGGQEEDNRATGDDLLDKESPTKEESVATGTIFSLDADSISLTPEKSTIPLIFEITTTTLLVDESDKKVARDLVLTGIGATVHYVTVGEKLMASKIVVTRKTLAGSGSDDPTAATRKRAELAETKVMKDEVARSKAVAVEGGGTLMGFEQVIAVRGGEATSLTQYTLTGSTLFVDSAGNPVPPHAVRTGVGLTVHYVEDAGRKLATKVTVQSMPAWVRQGLLAAEAGTAPNGPGAGASRPVGRTSNATQATGGGLSDAFIYPPILSLPSGQASGTTAANPAGQSNVNQPGANNQPNTTQPNTTQPNTTQPNTTQPNTTQPNTTQPNTTQPNTTQPDTKQPDTKQPDTRQPKTNNRPGTSPGGATTPGRSSIPSSPARPSTPSAPPPAK